MYDTFADIKQRTKPNYNAIDLLKKAEQIVNVLKKPIIDLKKLPGLKTSPGDRDLSWFHKDLGSLKQELSSFILKINTDEADLIGGDKIDDVKGENIRTCLIKIIHIIFHRINEMKAFLSNLALAPKSAVAIELIASLPPEIWTNIFSSLNYQEEINLSGVCKDIRQRLFFPNYVLVQRGFYSENLYKMSDVQTAYSQAESDAKVLLFFRSEDDFRASFRRYLNNLCSPVIVDVTKQPSL